jgi:hypothetical protein
MSGVVRGDTCEAVGHGFKPPVVTKHSQYLVAVQKYEPSRAQQMIGGMQPHNYFSTCVDVQCNTPEENATII